MRSFNVFSLLAWTSCWNKQSSCRCIEIQASPMIFIMSLQQNGVACLSSILSDPSMAETTRAEAAGVVAQMMSPLLEQYQQLAGFLEYMEDLVHSITGERQKKTTTLRLKCRHFDEVFITGFTAWTGSCHLDNYQCKQWWKFHENGDITVSVYDEDC